jgi:hypothetical protein
MSVPDNSHTSTKYGAVTDFRYWIFIKAERSEHGWEFVKTNPLLFLDGALGTPTRALYALCQLFYIDS